MDWIIGLVEKHTKDGVLDSEALKEDINKEFPKYAVPKEKYNALSETKTKLEEDIKARDKQLEQLKEIDAEGLKEQIEKLQEENRIAKETYEKELKDIQLSNAIKLAVNGKVHDEDLVAELISKEKEDLVLNEDGKVIGLDEKINTLKETKGFLFKEEKQQEPEEQPGFKVGNPKPQNPQAIDDAIAAAFGNLEEK